jgi:hypothetical protein
MVSASAKKGFASVSSETIQEENARAAAGNEQISVKCFASALCETVRKIQRVLGKVSVSEKAKLCGNGMTAPL